jgi:uncharacterized protein YoxC
MLLVVVIGVGFLLVALSILGVGLVLVEAVNRITKVLEEHHS